jgi:hypothetical protein
MMSHFVGLLLFTISLSPAPLVLQSAAQPALDAATSELVRQAEDTIRHLADGEYAAVVEGFSAKLREALPEQKLRDTWRRVESRAGKLRKTGSPRLRNRNPLRGVVVAAEFDKGKREIEVVFNADGKIAGLLFH